MRGNGSDKDKNEQEYIEVWERVYSRRENPFDVNEPYEWVMELEAQGNIRGQVLDAGCGTGDNSLYLSAKGHVVVGLDISTKAIERAKEKAAERGIENVEFRQANICKLTGYDGNFGTVIDIGCFHSLHEGDQKMYAKMLKKACKARALVYLRAFSTANTKRKGYPRVSEEQIRAAFSDGWMIIKLEQKEIERVLKLAEGKKVKTNVWFAEIIKL